MVIRPGLRFIAASMIDSNNDSGVVFIKTMSTHYYRIVIIVMADKHATGNLYISIKQYAHNIQLIVLQRS